MITATNQCSRCGHEMIIDHVSPKGTYFYTCVNKRCGEYRKAYSKTSEVKEALVREQD